MTEPVFNSRVFILEGGPKQAETVVLVHGLGDLGADVWRHQLPALSERYHVIAFDLPGFGRSEKKAAPYSPAQYSAFVHWVVSNYVQGPFILVGHSLGGAIALYYTGTFRPQPEKLILADVAGILHGAALARHLLQSGSERNRFFAAPLRLLDKLILSADLTPDWLPLDADDLVKDEELRTLILEDNPSRIAAIALVQTDFGPILDRIKVPTLILWGEDDSITPFRTGILLVGALENARTAIIPQAGHVPMLDQPQAFLRQMIEFVQFPAPQPSPGITPGSRIGICQNRSNVLFSGSYKSIQIDNCRNVKLEGVFAESVDIAESTVTIEKSVIKGGETGMTARNARITATDLEVEADHALETSQSTFDLAGTRLTGRETAIRSEDSDSFIFSACLVKSLIGTRYMHGKYRIIAQTPL